jgi:hypothetical protein
MTLPAKKRGILVLFMLLLSATFCARAQVIALTRGSPAFFDSIDRRINNLQQQVTRLKQSRDVSYYNIQRELDHALFVKSYEEYALNEDLDKARELVEARLDRSEFRKDMASVKYYNLYKDDVFALIKQQRIHYQQLFEKEKNFKKELDIYLGTRDKPSCEKALRMIGLALSYAEENNLTETISYLERYRAFVQALVFDMESTYDLAELTSNTREFEKLFTQLISSDTLQIIREAAILLDHCKDYSRLTNSSNDDFYDRLELAVTTAISELLERQGKELELSRYTDQAVTAKTDTINPLGIFKWHSRIIVIDEFVPTSSMENVKKGEAIMHADKMLATYLQKNKLCESVNDLKFGYAFVIPFKSNNKSSSFFFNTATEKWQYIACYSVINNPDYTSKVISFMAPLVFKEETGVIENQMQ